MFEDGDFEVVDECTGEDEAAETEAKIETIDLEKEGDAEKTNEDDVVVLSPTPKQGILKTPQPAADDTEKEKETAPSTVEKSNGDAVDFTADVSMDDGKDQPGEDDDGVIQIDVGDSVILDGEEPEQRIEGGADAKSVEEVDAEPEAIEEVPVPVPEEPLPPWYEEKLNGKMAIAKERMSKLARVLEFSYPAYKPWLDHYKDPVCHLDPPRRCSLIRPHTNRWKFICSRKPVQESTNKEEVSAEGTVNKKVETVWRLGPTDLSGVNTDNASQYPPFVMRVVKVFEEFIQNIESEGGSEAIETIKENSADPEIQTEETEVPAAAKENSDVAEVPAATADNPEIAETKIDEAEVEESNVEDAADSEEKQPETDGNKDETSTAGEKDTVIDRNHNWLWLLVRSNSKDELMVFATGKKISQSTMEKLKETFENGPGKDCNVKSLYCKSISKVGTSTSTNITFLAGSEALEETVGGLKVQLAPKTNFWCNAAGVEQLGMAVGDMLNPVQKFTVAEVGCGLGLIGLMQATKCRQIIGLDAPSEVEEAEMTSELNKIKNSSFVMGQPAEMMTQITKLLKSTRSAAIVNANTKIGRTIEMMTALRKISTLRRVVMITTLTKQSVRAILELTRPMDGDLGNPFMPVRAVLVDTLPVGSHFEVVIRMERLTMHKINESWFWSHVEFRAGLAAAQPQQQRRRNNDKSGNDPTLQSTKSGTKGATSAKSSPNSNSRPRRRSNYRIKRRNRMRKAQAQQRAAGQGVVVGDRIVVGPGLVTGVVKNAPNLVKNPLATANAIAGKRPHSPDKNNAEPTKKPTRNNRQGNRGGQNNRPNPTTSNPRQSNQNTRSNRLNPASPLKRNPLARPPGIANASGAQKRRRGWPTEVSSLRGVQPMPPKRLRDNENHGNDLRVRLSDTRMDPVLMQQVQEQQMLLNLAQQKLNNRGPVVDVDTAKQLHNMLNIVLEQTNKLQNQLPRSVWDRIEPPPGNSIYDSPSQINDGNNTNFRERFVHDVGSRDMIITAQNREFVQSHQQQRPLPLFPGNRLPLDVHQVAPSGMSPLEYMRGRQQIPERSPSVGRDYRKIQDHEDDWRRQEQFEKNRVTTQTMNKISPLNIQTESMRSTSPKRSLLSSPTRFNASAFVQQTGELRRPLSPPRRLMSPPRRLMSPPRRLLSPPRNTVGEIFHRRPSTAQSGRQQQDSNVGRRVDVSPSRQRDSMTIGRANSPFKKFSNDWDNRNSMEQGNWQSRQIQQQQQHQQQQNQRSNDRNVQEKRWTNDGPSNSRDWEDVSSIERYRKNSNQMTDKWSIGGGKDDTWLSGSGDAWNSKTSSMKSGNVEQRSVSAMTKPWGTSNSGPSGDNWNNRGKDGYGQSNVNRTEGWRDTKKSDKEDWNDLPEDARDPWADDGGPAPNKRGWQQSGGVERNSGSNWGRDNNDKINPNWSNNPLGGWPNKGSTLVGNKSQWSSVGSNNSKTNETRWALQNDGTKKPLMSGNWQSGGNNALDNWRSANYSQGFNSQRSAPFGSNNYKDGR